MAETWTGRRRLAELKRLAELRRAAFKRPNNGVGVRGSVDGAAVVVVVVAVRAAPRNGNGRRLRLVSGRELLVATSTEAEPSDEALVSTDADSSDADSNDADSRADSVRVSLHACCLVVLGTNFLPSLASTRSSCKLCG